MTFAAQLTAELERTGLTLEAAAKVLDVSMSWVDKAKRNEREPHMLMQEAALARLRKLPNKTRGK